MKNGEILDQFLTLVFQGQLEQALDLVHEEGEFLGGSVEKQPLQPLSGVYTGKDGARQFFANFQETLIPGDFQVIESLEAGDAAIKIGKLCHKSKKTQKDFKSHWLLYCKIKDGKISKYQFFEDTFALAQACHFGGSF